MRPGLLRSGARSIEADAAAFASEEGQKELFPDAIAFMNDLHLSLQDLQSFFPGIRRIEVEVLALDLQREDSAEVNRKLEDIARAVGASDAVRPPAKTALVAVDPDIVEAPDSVSLATLVADKTLIIRNFTAAAVRTVAPELKGVAQDSWQAFRKGFPKGIEKGAERIGEGAVVSAATWLVATIAGPLAALGGLISSFVPLGRKAQEVKDQSETARKSADELASPPDEPPTMRV